jgi:hypothetical protein
MYDFEFQHSVSFLFKMDLVLRVLTVETWRFMRPTFSRGYFQKAEITTRLYQTVRVNSEEGEGMINKLNTVLSDMPIKEKMRDQES